VRIARVLLTTDVVGGVWDFSVTLGRELVGRGTHVVLLALGEPSADQRRQASQAGAELIAEPLRLEWMQDSQADVLATQRVLDRLVQQFRPDVVHANQFAAACVAAPVVLTVHSDVLSWRKWTLAPHPPEASAGAKNGPGGAPKPTRVAGNTSGGAANAPGGAGNGPRGAAKAAGAAGNARDGAGEALAGEWSEPAEWQPYAALVRQALGRADAVVAVSRFLAREVQTLYGTLREIDVIPNGWPPAFESRRPRRRQTLVAGRVWDAAKNVQAALRAVPPGATVLLAGEQRHPETGGLADLPHGVQQLGFVPRERLDDLLAQTRIYLSAARYDPFGLLPLQAALNGCALLLSDIPSYREVWGDSAAFFETGQLQERWEWLLEDDAACASLAARARQRALERYSAARMADSYLDVYARVAAGVAV
jgi:Glycosyl transferase 4-like domain/Glycosyl transferases group 1